MLRPLDPFESPAPLAYRVPWRVDRGDEAHPIVHNDGAEPADFVRVTYDDARCVGDTDLLGQLAPGESFELCLCGADLDSIVVAVAWFRPSDGLEYVWRFVV
ncbi:hypothetical protein KAE78_00565 [Microbacterium sp. NIBRBAC000506063]|nr:hypothetical protein KAE78_00565 [Microbacterium sp. NIBRBAC000506063]